MLVSRGLGRPGGLLVSGGLGHAAPILFPPHVWEVFAIERRWDGHMQNRFDWQAAESRWAGGVAAPRWAFGTDRRWDAESRRRWGAPDVVRSEP